MLLNDPMEIQMTNLNLYNSEALIEKIIENVPARYYQNQNSHREEILNLMIDLSGFNSDGSKVEQFYRYICNRSDPDTINMLEQVSVATKFWSEATHHIEKLRSIIGYKFKIEINEIEDFVLEKYHGNLTDLLSDFCK